MKSFIYILCAVSFLSLNAQSQNKKMDRFISDLMKKMTIEEKIGQLNLLTPGSGIPTGSVVSTDVEKKISEGKVGGIFGIHGPDKIRRIQDIAMKNSRMKIPLFFGSDVIHGYQTTFPIPLGMAASWDLDYIEKAARISAIEASANGVNWTFSPMVDICRDPRWGRIAEGAGEDSYLGSRIAEAYVKGYQADMTNNTNIMSCVKHFAMYGAAEGGRDYNTTDMSRIRMVQDYLPPYKAAIDAGVMTVMTSFNEIDGIPATGNKWLLTNVLREQWRFKGFVVSDYTSVNEMIDHGMGDLQEVSALSLNAGLDMDMVGEGYLTTLQKSKDEKKISLNQIDQACKRILEAKYKLGLFKDPYRYIDETRPSKEIMTKEHRLFAKEVAKRSMVLLKNMDQQLPLLSSDKIAFIGPLLDSRNNMLGTWAVSGELDKAVTIIEGLKNVIQDTKNFSFCKGANISDDSTLANNVNVFGPRIDIDKRSPETMIDEAMQQSMVADKIVLFIGEASEMSGEASSRTRISIPESQKKLIRKLHTTGKPIILCILAGRPLDLTEESELAHSILWIYHPGTEAGNAMAEVLFGKYNPSGKITNSFPRNVGQIPIYYNHKRTGRPSMKNEFEKFRSDYLDESNEPLYPFGFGLSYTNFEYKNLHLDKTKITPTLKINVTVDLRNIGDYNAEEVVQLYIQDMQGSVTRPVKELKNFKKVSIPKGEQKTITFEISESDLRFYNSKLEYISEAGTFKVFVGGNSRDVLEQEFELIK